MNARLALYDVVERYQLDGTRAAALFRLAGFDTEPASVSKRFWQVIAVLAATLIGFGVILWIAANWQEIGRMGHFLLLQAVIVIASVAAAWSARHRAPLALAALLCTGGLLAYFGQTYQTGADVWQLFALWAVLSLPLALGAQSDVLWAPWTLVASVAISLWVHAHIGRAWAVRSEDLGVHAVGWAACIALILAMSPLAQRWTGAGVWALRGAGTFTAILLTVTALMALVGGRTAPQFVLALVLFAAAALAFARQRWFDVFLLSVAALALDTLLVAGFCRVLFTGSQGGDPIPRLLAIGLAAAGLLSLSVSLIMKIAKRHAH